ncbi:MAG: DUF4266 domain-containing protein [Bdellovibrionales bacterium]|nr:DUF4266 domain-containing protein [Bdellovibrionales bacterium]
MKKKLSLFLLSSFIFVGCSSLGVKPWEREILSRKHMQFNADPIDSAFDDHIYFSKEASSGGRGFAGGGCGCN